MPGYLVTKDGPASLFDGRDRSRFEIWPIRNELRRHVIKEA